MNQKTAVVLSNTEIAGQTKKLILRSSENIDFIPGQFISLIIPNKENKPIIRAYSIADIKDKKHIELLVRIVPNGIGSTFIKNLKEVDKVDFLGPLGKFILADLNEDYLFIATGVGVVPFIPMINSLLSKDSKQKITLLLGFRFEEDIFYADIFEKWQKEYENFNFTCTLSKPKESWKGNIGRVTKHLIDSPEIFNNKQIYICGSGNMVENVENIALEKGISKDHIFFEKYNNI